MNKIRFTDDHEWVIAGDNGEALVGITDYAQEQLGELVFIELPEVGDTVAAGDSCAVIESVKSASELHSPVSGEIIEVNTVLIDDPGIVNEDPMEAGWLISVRMSDESELDDLMDKDSYEQSFKD